MDSACIMIRPSENKSKLHDDATPRILMFAPAFAPYSFSESIVNSKLALAFQRSGWRIDTISRAGDGPRYSAAWNELWQPLKGSTHTIEYPLGNRINRFIDLIRQSSRLHYPIDGIRWAGRALDRAIALHKKHPYKFVLSRSPSDIGHVPALAFARQTKVPWIANWNDPPAQLWPAPYKSECRFLRKTAFHRLMVRVLDEASVVTFPSERLCKHTLQSTKMTGKIQTKIIPHIGLPGYVSSKRRSDGCFRICHAGNLSHERDPKTFLEGIARFVGRASMTHPFELRILGNSDHELSSLAQGYGLTSHIKISGGLNYFDTFAILEQSDVLAVVEAPCKEGIFLPSKVADYAQIGRSILAVSPSTGTLADLIPETRAGEIAACGQPESVAKAIWLCYKSWRAGLLSQDYSSKILWEQFRPENVIRQYEKIFSEITASPA